MFKVGGDRKQNKDALRFMKVESKMSIVEYYIIDFLPFPTSTFSRRRELTGREQSFAAVKIFSISLSMEGYLSV